ncbi:Gfo/Idh/MocA family protein [Pontibacter sp. CAU 1760]
MPDTLTTPVRFAVIGVGRIGSRHAALISQRTDAALVALIDNKDGFLDDTAPDFPGVRRFASLQEFLSAGMAADVLCVCTPNFLHHPHTLLGLQHGLHVVCEKPMALSSAHALEMIATAEQHDRQIFCVMQNRYSPPAQWLKGIITEGLLGQVFHVQVNCFWNRDERYYTGDSWRGKLQQDGGTLFTQFSHFVDLLHWLFGDVTGIQGHFRDFRKQQLTEFEDSGFLQFEFRHGGTGTLNFSTAVYALNLESSMIIIAEHGSIKVGGQYMDRVEHCHLKGYEMPALRPSLPANHYGVYTGSASNHQYVFDNVIRTLQLRETPDTSAHDGLKVVEIIERFYAGREINKLTKPATSKALKA